VSESPHGSLQRLAEQNPLAGELVGLLSGMASLPLRLELLTENDAGLPPELVEGLADETARAKLVGVLEKEGLIVTDGDARASVPEEVAQEIRMEATEGEVERWIRAALHWLESAFPQDPGDVRDWGLCSELFPHAVASVDHALDFGLRERSALALLNRAAAYRAERCDYPLARELMEQALASCKRLENGDPLIGQAHLVRGMIFADIGEWEPAHEELKTAIGALQTSVETGHPDLRRARIALASLMIDRDNPEEAEAELRKALAEQGDEPDDRPAGAAHKLLGWVLAERGDREAAAAEYERALAMAAQQTGPDHPDTAGVLSSLGVLQTERGDLEEAEEGLQRALEISEAALGPEHLQVAVIRSNLSDALIGLGQPAAAQLHLQRSISIAEAVLPPIHRVLWIRHRKLAAVARNLAATQEALSHAEQALAICEELYGTNDHNFAQDLAMLAAVHASRGEWSAARDGYERAISLMHGSPKASDREVARHTQALGRTLRDLGDLPGARDRIGEALHELETLSDAAEDVASARIDLVDIFARVAEEAAVTSDALGRGEDAEVLREKTLGVFEAVLGGVLDENRLGAAIAVADTARGRSPELALKALGRAEDLHDGGVPGERLRVASAWHRLGQERGNQSDAVAARSAFERALALLEGYDHFRAMVFHELGTLFYREGSYAQAAEGFSEAVELRKTLGDNSDPQGLASSFALLGRSYEEDKQYEQATSAYKERLELLRSLPRPDPQAEGVTLHDMADVLWAQERREEAVELYRRAAECKRKAGENPRDLGITLSSLGNALEQLEKYEDARGAYEERLEILKSLPERDPEAEGITLQDLGDVHRAMDQLDEAAARYRHAAEIRRELDPRGAKLAYSLFSLGRTLERLHALEEAQQAYEERLEILPSLAERQPQAEGVTMHDLADVLRAQWQFEEAAELYRKAIERKREAGETAPPGSMETTLLALASAEHSIGRSRNETREAVAKALGALRAQESPDSYQLASALVLAGDVATVDEDFQAAAASYEEAANLFTKIPEPNRLELASLQFLAGDAYASAGREDEAQSAREIAKEAFVASLEAGLSAKQSMAIPAMAANCVRVGAPDLALRAAAEMRALRKSHPEEEALAESLAEILFTVGREQEASGDYDAASASYEERLETLSSFAAPNARDEGVTLHDLGDVRLGQKRPQEAVDYYRRAIERKRNQGDELPRAQLAVSLIAVARAELDADPQARPVEHAEEAIEIYRAEGEEAHDPLAASLCVRAECHLRDDEPAAALSALEEAEALLEDPTIDAPMKRAALKELAGDALEALGKPAEAKEARTEAQQFREAGESGK